MLWGWLCLAVGTAGALELVWNSSMDLEYLDSSPGSYIYLTWGTYLNLQSLSCPIWK